MAEHNPAQGSDPFERKLDTMIGEVKQCQETKGLKSCSACDKLLACDLRKAYVSAVYDSMSKGETGGFEF